MSIRNINTIQNPNDLAYIISDSEKYMYESLANLGQRFSIKGDGVITNYFTPLSIMNLQQSEYDPETYISKLSIIDNKLYLQIFNKSNIYEPLISEEFKYTLDNVIYTDAPIILNTKINGVDYYKENMMIFNTGDVLNICSIGCDDELGTVELNIDQYDINSNILVNSLKVIKIDNTDDYFIYYLFNEPSTVDIDYFVYKYKLNKTTIDSLYGDFATFVESVYINTIILYYNSHKNLNTTDIFNELITSFDGTDTLPLFEDKHYHPVNYNKEYQGFTAAEEQFASELNPVLAFMYNQLVYMYEFIFQYYTEFLYKYDNVQLNKYILYKIFLRCFNDSNTEYIENYELYIPVDYIIDYFCKDNNTYYVYSNETPINVFYTTNKLTEKFLEDFYINNLNNSTLLLSYNKAIETVVLYKFSVNYNTLNNNLINNISVNTIYSTPYILDDYWVINGQKTDYKAIGKDAGNPNIILLYTNDIFNKSSNFTTDDYTLLSTISRQEIIDNVEWTKETINTNLLDYIDTSEKEHITKSDYKSYVLVPSNVHHTQTTLNTLLSNSLIINMSNVNNIVANEEEKAEIKDIIGNNSFITSFWVYDNENQNFVNVHNPINNSYSLTLSNLTSINSIISNQLETELYNMDIKPDNYKYTYLVFNTSYATTKNVYETQDYYGVLYNKSLKYYQQDLLSIETTSNELNIANNLMFILRYVDIVGKHNSYIGNSTYFITDENVDNIQLTNILTKYKLRKNGKDDEHSNNSDFIPSINTPLFNTEEVLLMNSNFVNRVNILSFEEGNETTNKMYYSYLGTQIDNANKNILHIGTSNINTAMGIDSLMDPKHIDKFNTHDGISFDFDNIYLNSTYTYTSNIRINEFDKNETEETCTLDYIYTFNYSKSADLIINDSLNELYTINEIVETEIIPLKIQLKYFTNLIIDSDYVLLPITNILVKAGLPYNTDANISATGMDIIDINGVKYLLCRENVSNNTHYIDLKIIFNKKEETILDIQLNNNLHKYNAFPVKVHYKTRQ